MRVESGVVGVRVKASRLTHRRRFTRQFKRAAVRLLEKDQRPVAEMTRKVDIRLSKNGNGWAVTNNGH